MNEEKKRGLLTTILVCLFILLCFGIFRNPGDLAATTTHTKDGSPKKPQAVSNTVHAANISYTLKLEGETLNLYLNSDTEKFLMESFTVNDSLFPGSDITDLRAGITTEKFEKIINLIEDFTS